MSVISDYINKNLDIEVEYKRIFGKEIPTGKMFCPFHTNVNTPAAKRYGNGIKCFGQCQRYYTLYDLLKKFDPKRIEEIKSTQILDVPVRNISKVQVSLIDIDRTQPIDDILEQICK